MSNTTTSKRIAIGRIIGNKRRELGMTQTQLAKTINSQQYVISELENGKRNVRFDVMITVLDALCIQWKIREKGPCAWHGDGVCTQCCEYYSGF